MQTLMTRFAALEAAGFLSDVGARRTHWRHVRYDYVTVTCVAGVWTMQSSGLISAHSFEIKNDLDIPVALDLLTGGN